MKIELQHPFSEIWKSGYLRKGKDGRKRVDLFNNSKDRTTISYARYLKSVQIGEVISKEFEVDHKDNDKTNDSLDNLVILSKKDHRKKTKENGRGVAYVSLICYWCEEEFQREKRQVKKGKSFCSRKCNGKHSYHKNNRAGLAELVDASDLKSAAL